MNVEPVCKVYVLMRYGLPMEVYTDLDKANVKADRLNSTLSLEMGNSAYCYIYKVNLYS
jgi:hypothetical protein